MHHIYKPPTQQETISRGRKAKHINHYIVNYIGAGTISRQIGTRSVVVTIRNRNSNGIEIELLISQQHVYDRVWARGHASTG
jgi:hypothetical protein